MCNQEKGTQGVIFSMSHAVVWIEIWDIFAAVFSKKIYYRQDVHIFTSFYLSPTLLWLLLLYRVNQTQQKMLWTWIMWGLHFFAIKDIWPGHVCQAMLIYFLKFKVRKQQVKEKKNAQDYYRHILVWNQC